LSSTRIEPKSGDLCGTYQVTWVSDLYKKADTVDLQEKHSYLY